MNDKQIDLNELTSSIDTEFYKEKSIDIIIGAIFLMICYNYHLFLNFERLHTFMQCV